MAGNYMLRFSIRLLSGYAPRSELFHGMVAMTWGRITVLLVINSTIFRTSVCLLYLSLLAYVTTSPLTRILELARVRPGAQCLGLGFAYKSSSAF